MTLQEPLHSVFVFWFFFFQEKGVLKRGRCTIPLISSALGSQRPPVSTWQSRGDGFGRGGPSVHPGRSWPGARSGKWNHPSSILCLPRTGGRVSGQVRIWVKTRCAEICVGLGTVV